MVRETVTVADVQTTTTNQDNQGTMTRDLIRAVAEDQKVGQKGAIAADREIMTEI